MDAVSKKKVINWFAPSPISDAFDEVVTRRHGGKGKWVGATAAMLMYLAASEDEQKAWDKTAQFSGVEDEALRILAEIRDNKARSRIAAKIAPPIHTTPVDEDEPQR